MSSSDSESDNNSDGVDTNSNSNGGDGHHIKLIERQTKTHIRRIPNIRSLETMQNDFQLKDAMYFCKSGIEVGQVLGARFMSWQQGGTCDGWI